MFLIIYLFVCPFLFTPQLANLTQEELLNDKTRFVAPMDFSCPSHDSLCGVRERESYLLVQ